MNETDTPVVILLDLNFTLVANSKATFDYQRGPNVDRETYRNWLIELIRDYHVILITSRTDDLLEATLASIQAKTGWQPQETQFKPAKFRFSLKAHQWKEKALVESIFRRFGTAGANYLALESNAETRAMYARHGIPAIRVPDDANWTELPKVVPPATSGKPMVQAGF